MTRVALPYGLVADLADLDTVTAAPAAKPARIRRWAKNGHQWESCACFECTSRRLGIVGAEYGERNEPSR